MHLLAALLLAATVTESAPLACSAEDERGQPFRTCFDPWVGLELGGGAGLESARLGGSFNAGLRLRGARESNSKAESTWLLLHHLGSTELRLGDGNFELRALGYTGVFRRHVREGVILLPLTPPVQVPFPLDVSFMAEVARYERRTAEGTDWSFEPVRLSMLLDPLRSASNRFHLSLGVTAAWRLRQLDSVVVHDVTPLTAATLFFTFSSEDGLWLARGTGTAGWSFTAPTPALTFKARGELELSRVLFALNDQPISFFIRGGGAFRDGGARGTDEWWAHAGLTLRLFSK